MAVTLTRYLSMAPIAGQRHRLKLWYQGVGDASGGSVSLATPLPALFRPTDDVWAVTSQIITTDTTPPKVDIALALDEWTGTNINGTTTGAGFTLLAAGTNKPLILSNVYRSINEHSALVLPYQLVKPLTASPTITVTFDVNTDTKVYQVSIQFDVIRSQ